MHFEVTLFAYHREQHGSSIIVESEPNTRSVLAALAASGLAVDHCRLAVDEAFARDETPIRADSKLALIPPVSGG